MIGLALFTAWALGWLVVAAVWPRDLVGSMRSLRAVLAAGVGIGTASLLAFVILVVDDGLAAGRVVAVEIAVIAVLALVVRRRRGSTTARREAEPDADVAPIVVALLVVAFAAALVVFVLATRREPHGVTDALSIWNLRSRLLFDSGEHWRNAFAPELAITHTDYPLLVPLAVVRTWLWLGDSPTVVPAIVAGVFTFGTAALLWAALRALGAGMAGAVAAAALLGFPAFVAAGSTQLADVPLAFFALAACVLLVANDRWRPASGALIGLAGFALGLAAWTKNEGLLLIVVMTALRTLGRMRLGFRAAVTDVMALAAGALPALLPLLVFKMTLVPPNDLMAHVAGGHGSARVLDGSRWVAIGNALLREAWAAGPLMLVAVASWWSWRRCRCTFPLAVAAAMLAGYFMVYLVASQDLEWHLATSAQRLLLQLLPMALFGVFVPVARPATEAR